MDFSRINPARVAETPATWNVTYEGEPAWNGDEKNPLQIDFFGLDSRTGKIAMARLARRLDAAGGSKTRNIQHMDVERILSRGEKTKGLVAEFYAELVDDWRNIPDLEATPGKDGIYPTLEFSRESAARLFRDCGWMIKGIEDFLALRRVEPLKADND